MKLQTFILLALLLSFCSSAPILRQQLGIIASNSNEILRLPGLTLASMGLGQAQVQGSPFLSPFLIQPQSDLLLPHQVLNFGPNFPGQFLPLQQNLPHLLLPSIQQENPAAPVYPNNPNNPLSTPTGLDPAQVVPHYFPFPQTPGVQGFPMQGFPYYMTYGFPPRNTLHNLSPNQNTANQNVANQNPVRPTKVPPPVQNNGKEPLRVTPPPDNRGDRPGRGVVGDPAFPFFQP